MVQQVLTWVLRPDVVSVRIWVQSLDSLRGLRIWRCHELSCRWQMWLGSCIAVAVAKAGGYSSNSTLHLGTSISVSAGLKSKEKNLNFQTYEIQTVQVSVSPSSV